MHFTLGEPVHFAGQVIKGWDLSVATMKKGEVSMQRLRECVVLMGLIGFLMNSGRATIQHLLPVAQSRRPHPSPSVQTVGHRDHPRGLWLRSSRQPPQDPGECYPPL